MLHQTDIVIHHIQEILSSGIKERRYSVKETRGQPINGALKQAIPGQPPERTYILFWEFKKLIAIRR